MRNFVFVVNGYMVNATRVDIKVRAKIFSTHSGALYVPTGITYSPRRIPFKLLILKLLFREPKNEVGFVLLVTVFLNALTNTYRKIFFVEIVENVILFKL